MTQPAPEPSRHKCLIYDGEPSEQLSVVVPLLMDGLRDNWRCLYLGDPESVRMVGDALAARGVNTASETQSTALVLSSDRSHLKGGRFDPEAMVGGLSSSIDDAVRDGYQGLCATGDMRWELGDDANFGRLLEYEALLDRLFRDKPLRGICQYHRGILPPSAVRDALVTHRAAYVNGAFNRDNLFYVPPELLLAAQEGDGGSKYGDWMCSQIIRVLDAERARDDVLRELERRVAERTAELSVANRQLRAFSYSVSHDLRAPLRAIQGFATALAEDSGDGLDEAGRAHLARVLSNATRMGELIDGMLTLGRVVEAELRRTPVDLSAIAADVGGELAAADPSRSVELSVERGLTAVGDPALLRAVVTNLLSNAWKFTSKRPGARVDVGRLPGADAGTQTFFVKDNGAGFDEGAAKRLFGAFQRLHAASEFPGTGIGLATVERIVSRHGGRIWAEGRVDHGATFWFTLPDLPPV